VSTISVIVPTLNESSTISTTLERIGAVRGLGEIIVIDGGSSDGTQKLVCSHGVRLIETSRGRGNQLHVGALVAAGDILWFVHADTHPPQDASEHIRVALSDRAVVGGNFAIRFDGARRAASLLTWLYPHLRWLGLCYGDSGIFVRRAAYEEVGGFRSYPIFEDLDLLRRLRRLGRLSRLQASVTTSSRRFEDRSFIFTFAWWSVLQVLFWLHVSPRFLGRLYAPIRGKGGAVLPPGPASAPTAAIGSEAGEKS
jgi:rSAM/selenodomain-associated transferase 2